MAYTHVGTKYIKRPWDFENFLEFWSTLIFNLFWKERESDLEDIVHIVKNQLLKKKQKYISSQKKKSNDWNIKRNLSVWSGLSRRKELKREHDEQRQPECGGREGDGRRPQERYGQDEEGGEVGRELPEHEEEATEGVDEGGHPRSPTWQLDQDSRLVFSSFNPLLSSKIDSLFHAQWWLPSGGCSSLASWLPASCSCAFQSLFKGIISSL